MSLFGPKLSRHAPPVQIFQARWLERLTYMSFRVWIVFWGLMMVGTWTFCLVTVPFLPLLGWALVGMGAWLVTEYVCHRWPFHFKTEIPALKRMVYIIHGNHHVQPRHPLRTLMPLVVSIPFGLGVAGVCAWIGGEAGKGMFAGFLSGYFMYDAVHYGTHNWPMEKGWAAFLRRHHAVHHYAEQNTNFHISFPVMDYLLGSDFTRWRKRQHKLEKSAAQTPNRLAQSGSGLPSP
ncbi:hypothetical protein E3E12_03490 [Formicincola oecophyllae]|uniref:Fatty acid hydroxylase domain-containing protein n=1 Tax=Formicincola oecophyllae TaxID=2558361 RepID=A0A4Y6UAK4_9PROT|nr:sterol desaturase family protein [Formicincola oecophyllae]QDH13421.1 hypothetical protein E3E12_03490 [Formicincola oecophyllae]